MKKYDLNEIANEIRTETKELMEYVFDCYADEEQLNKIIDSDIETFHKSISIPMETELKEMKNGIEQNVFDYLTSYAILDMLNLDKDNDEEIINELCDKLTNEIYDYLDKEASKRNQELSYDEEER